MLRIRLAIPLCLLLVAPCWAQEDPFATTVGGGDNTAPVRGEQPVAPTSKQQLRALFESVRALNIAADAGLPTGNRVRLKAGFSQPPEGGAPVLSSLSVVPTRAISTGDGVAFRRVDLDRHGNLHVELNHEGRPVNLTIHKIYRDDAGNLVFRTFASNLGRLGNRFVPDLRITPNGTLQTRQKNAFRKRKRCCWETVRDRAGRAVRLERSLPIDRWPPRLTDLVDLLPEDEAGDSGGGGFLESIPIRDLNLTVEGEAAEVSVPTEGGGSVDIEHVRGRLETKHRKRRGAAGALGGVEVDGEYTLSGTADSVRVRSRDGTTVDLSQAELRSSGRGTLDAGGLREGQASADLTLRAPATIDLPLGEKRRARAKVQLAPGTRIEVDTGPVTRNPDGTLEAPQTRVRAHLVVDGGSAAWKKLTLASLKGGGPIDLDATLGLRIDPAKLRRGEKPLAGPVPLDLSLTVAFDEGSSLSLAGQELPFGGKTKVKLDLRGEVDPATGRPSVSGAGADITFLEGGPRLDPEKLKGFADDVQGKTGNLLQAVGVDLEFAEGGLRLRHDRARVDLESDRISVELGREKP